MSEHLLKEFENAGIAWCEGKDIEENREWIVSLVEKWTSLGYSANQVKLIEEEFLEPFEQYDSPSEELAGYFEGLVKMGLIIVPKNNSAC